MRLATKNVVWQSASATLLLAILAIVGCNSGGSTPPIVVSVTPLNASVAAGSGTQVFTASVTNDSANKGVTWTLTQSATACSPACGTLTNSSTSAVTYVAPATIPANALASLTAQSISDPTKTGSATIAVTAPPPVAVLLAPKRGSLVTKQSVNLTATVSNDIGAAGVTWSAAGTGCSGSACGTFTNVTPASATYTAPATPGTFTITATSVADNSKTATSVQGVSDLSGVFTYHNDASRDGSNPHEVSLTPANLSTTTFGKLFSCAADGAIYAQPLWVPGVTIAGKVHNIVLVATQHDSLYAFDADASPCSSLWQVSLIDSAHGGTAGETSVISSGVSAQVGSGFGDIAPEVGVTGTPVIDPATSTLYVVSKSVNGTPQFFQRLHAIDITTGNDRVAPHSIDSSVSVSGTGDGSVNGQVAFDPQNEHQRAGLVLSNGVIYVAWASHEDHDPYHGWVMGFSAATLAPIANAVLNTTPNHAGVVTYSRGGIWMGGGAPAVDANGSLYCITGNGTFDADSGGSNYGDTVLKLSTSGGLAVADYFTPLDQATLDTNDTDFGSGAATVLVDQPAGPVHHLVIGGGKAGFLFLLNRDNLGAFSNATNHVVGTVNVGNSIF